MSFMDECTDSSAGVQMSLDGPALPPPPGVIPNFDHPINGNDLATLTNIVCLTITTVTFVLRAYVKIFCVKRLQIEDYLITVALGTFISCICCNIWIMNSCGVLVHQWNIRLKDIGSVLYIFLIGSSLSSIALIILKASILLEFIRIFVPPGTRNSFFWISVALLIIHTIFQATYIIFQNLSCNPPRKVWDITMSGTCIDIKVLHVLVASVNLVINIIILFLPQKAIWSLNMSLKRKIGVSMTFTIGLLACVSAMLRLNETLIYYHTDDVLFAESGMYLWALGEMTCLFLVFCVPAIPKAFVDGRFKKISRSLFSRCPWPRNCGSRWFLWSRRAKSPSSSLGYPLHGGYAHDDTEASSDESIMGPVTEITAGAKDDDERLSEGPGIWCTTLVRTEVTTATNRGGLGRRDQNKEFERYQRLLLS
ncbi:hypothetical protein GGS21DRAFT_113844 [Xylaria nigripes]|nr:hypothetical protein GGS21DRAFT_113844 [Xylaria nigripes]